MANTGGRQLDLVTHPPIFWTGKSHYGQVISVSKFMSKTRVLRNDVYFTVNDVFEMYVTCVYC